jgi:hypothetical protein
MFVGVTITRRGTSTILREFHEVDSEFGGPNRGMVDLARSVSNRFTDEWDISCLQLTEMEYRSFVRGQKAEKEQIEKAIGMTL